jgi:hypothetical protein
MSPSGLRPAPPSSSAVVAQDHLTQPKCRFYLTRSCRENKIFRPKWFIAGKCRERTDAIEKGSRLLRLPFRAFIECIFGLGGGGDSLARADLTQFKTLLS